MFEKKQIIFSESMGVCQVKDIVKLSANGKDKTVTYYHLISIDDNQKSCYIPVENHKVKLRELISYDEALNIIKEKDLPELKVKEAKYVINLYKKNKNE